MKIIKGQWVELIEHGTAKVIEVWRDGSFVARLGDGAELSGLTVEHVRVELNQVLARIEAL